MVVAETMDDLQVESMNREEIVSLEGVVLRGQKGVEVHSQHFEVLLMTLSRLLMVQPQLCVMFNVTIR